MSYAFLTHLVSKHGIRKLLLLDILLVEDASVQEAYIEHLQVRNPSPEYQEVVDSMLAVGEIDAAVYC